jgi:hypothetical protein
VAIADWSAAFSLEGAIAFNFPQTILDPGGNPLGTGQFILDNTACRAGVTVRATNDNIPQFDGSILHRRFLTGQQVTLRFSYWEYWEGQSEPSRPACDQFLQDSDDFFMRSLYGTLVPTFDIRLFAGVSTTYPRHLKNCSLGVAPELSTDSNGVTSVTFGLESPFPYWISDEEFEHTSFPTGIENDGSIPYYPVWQVEGPTDGFILEDTNTGKQIVYDSSLPGAVAIGGGDYVEIDTFKGTAFLNGSGADLLAGIDPDLTEFWPALPVNLGGSVADVTGLGTFAAPNATLLAHHAWW